MVRSTSPELDDMTIPVQLHCGYQYVLAQDEELNEMTREEFYYEQVQPHFGAIKPPEKFGGVICEGHLHKVRTRYVSPPREVCISCAGATSVGAKDYIRKQRDQIDDKILPPTCRIFALNQQIFLFQAPSTSLCLSILELHSQPKECGQLILKLSDDISKFLQPISPGVRNPEVDYSFVIR